MKQFSRSDIAQYGKNSSKKLIIVDGSVYDVTSFIPEHPGGAKPLEGAAGSDAATDERVEAAVPAGLDAPAVEAAATARSRRHARIASKKGLQASGSREPRAEDRILLGALALIQAHTRPMRPMHVLIIYCHNDLNCGISISKF